MDYNTYTLSNGIRLIHRPSLSLVAHVGLFINAGSRDEEKQEHGLAHFIEHAIFKGTKKRKVYHILSRLEDLGGELNAFTSKEETCIHASFLKEDYPKTIELISDILFNSTFPENEIKREKEVIIDEINSYNDSPSELIFDEFENTIFNGSSIGRLILGNFESLKSFNRQHILKFIKKNYNTDQMILSSIGDIDFDKLIRIFTTYFEKAPLNNRKYQREKVSVYKPQHKVVKKDTFHSHCIIGNRAYCFSDKRRIALYLLNNIMGGPGMNSRLNMTIREKYGYSYNIESNFNSFTDTGIFSVYFSSDKINLERALNEVYKEFERLCTKKLGVIQLSKAKRQLNGQLAIAYESNETQMLTNGKNFMIFEKISNLDEIYRKINSLTSQQLIDTANEILNKKQMSSLIYQ